MLCSELLSETGSVFIQIGDENIHRVRLLLDEVFGPRNFVSLITVKKTTGGTGRYDLRDGVWRPRS
jgi:adenine-specific DNA-methyltransferase